MKKILALMAGVALLFTSTMFTSCSDSDDDSSSSGSSSANKTGSIVGVVLDNKGEPVEGATVTLGSKTATTNYGGEFEIKDVAVNDAALVTAGSSVLPTTGSTTDTRTTAYTLTAKKDGYLSSKVTGIYVTYKEKEAAKSKDYQDALRGALTNDYATILDDYAQNTTNSTQAATTIVGTAAGTDVGYSQTTTNTNDISGVMTIIANALKDLESLYKDSEWSVENYADFASAALIPCDASFTGSVKLNLSPIESQTGYSEKTYIPTSEPTVRMSYTSGTNDYVFTAKVAKDGTFKFEKLPSGVTLKLTVDAFIEKIEDTQYYFSGTAADYILDNTTTSEQNGTNIKLGSGDANEKSCVLMLHAQYDKIWIVESNLFENETGSLIDVATPFTFTFNKEMKEVGITATNLKDVTDKAFTVTLSDDKKTATVTPTDGSWTASAAATNPTVTLTAHAVDGTNVIVNGNAITVYLDVYNYVSLVTTSYDDETSRLALDSEIKLAFSKAVKGDVVLNSPNTYQYTKTWSDDRKTLTLKPVTYWPAFTSATNTATNFAIATAKSLSGDDESATVTFKYWKAHSSTTGLAVYFNAYVDVELEDASTANQEAFKIKFSKALKSFDVKGNTNLTAVKIGADTLTINKDYTLSINDAKTEVTVSAKDGVFTKEGNVKVSLAALEAVDGSTLIREVGKLTAATTLANLTSYKFAYEGFWLKPVAIEVVNTLPASAKLSRAAIIDATTDQYLKLSFNKNIYKSAITLKTGDDATAAAAVVNGDKAKNYIDGKDVYVALADVANVKKVLVLADLATVTAEDGETLDTTSHTDWTTLTSGLEFRIYAALTLEGSSLVAETPDVNGYKTYKEADPVANKTVTFTFNKELPTTYTAEVDLYSWNAKKNTYTKSVDTAKIACDGSKTVTFTSDKLLPIIEKEVSNADNTAVYTTHYLSLVVKNEAGVVLFSTKTASFGNEAGSFDVAFDALVDKKSGSSWASAQEFNTVKVNVAPYAITNYSLVTEVTDVAGNKSYKALPAVPAKTPLVFTFNALPAGATASYDLELDGKLIEEAKAATVDATANKVTIASDKLVFDADKAAAATGRTEYKVTLSVKDADGNIVFTTDNTQKTKFAVVKDSYEQKVFVPVAGKEVKDSTDTTANPAPVALYAAPKLSVKVAPLTLVGTSLVKATVNPLDETDVTYKLLNPIVPGASVDFTFSDDLTGATVEANVYGPASKATVGTNVKLEGTTATVAGKTVTVSNAKMLSYSNTASTSYYVELKIIKDGKLLFSVEKDYFGAVDKTFEKVAVVGKLYYDDTDYNGSTDEQAALKSTVTVNAVDHAAIKVDVVKTAVVTKAMSKTATTTTSTDFAKSYNSDIVLQFTHNVPGYTAVLYKTAATINLNDKLADVQKLAGNVGKIYDSKVVAAASNNVTLSIGTNKYFSSGETVKVAIFDDSDDKVCVITDVKTTDKDGKNDGDKANFIAKVAVAGDETNDYISSLTAGELALTVDGEAAKVGNTKKVKFGPIPVHFSADKSTPATYTVYGKTFSSNAANNDKWIKLSDTTATTAAVSYEDAADGKGVVDADDLTYTDYTLHNFKYAYVTVTFASDAFGYDGVVDVAVLEEYDETRALFSKTGLKDVVAPELTLSGAGLVADGSDVTKYRITGISAVAPANASTDPVADPVAWNNVLTITGNEWLSTAKAELLATGKHTSAHVSDGKVSTTEAVIGKVNWTSSTTGTVEFTKTAFFKGDIITITATDASGKEATYTITIE
ncbi:hypothetical protein [uncultured Treponema sp.]|uniref:hypothetical protein n=1 Tax=uncultured Treponema sp. TaxID=162155 RepID=UPI0025FF2B48|nr:hypothetical protein [uncultured Treponema sp.]